MHILKIIDKKMKNEKRVLDTYLGLCAEYYDLDKPILPQDEWDFYYEYAQRAQGIILEPMCGSGRFLLPLRNHGCDVRGFDASSSMLKRLYAQCVGTDYAQYVWQGFIEDLDQVDNYSLAFIPSGSFNLIADKHAAQLSLNKLYQSLLKEGLLVIELMTTQYAQSQEYESYFYSSVQRNETTYINLKTKHTAFIDGVSQSVCTYVLVENNQPIATESEIYSLRFYDPQEFKGMLEQAGFSEVKYIKAFEYGTEASMDDTIIVFECKK